MSEPERVFRASSLGYVRERWIVAQVLVTFVACGLVSDWGASQLFAPGRTRTNASYFATVMTMILI
jgi:hypothetical protein